MTLVELRRNDVRLALVDFNYELMNLLADAGRVSRVKEIESKVNNICISVKQKYRNSAYKDDIRKAINEQARDFRERAKEVADHGRLHHGKLMYDIYDGIPLTQSFVPDRPYDIIIRLDVDRIKAIVYAPSSKLDGYDALQSQIQAENDFGLHCAKVDERCKLPHLDLIENRNPRLSNSRQPKPQTKEAEVTVQETTAKANISLDNIADSEKTSQEHIILGKVLFNRKDQFNLRADQKRDEIKGFLFEEYINRVQPLDILVLEEQETRRKIYAITIKIDVNPMSGGGYVHRFSEIATHVVFQPLKEKGEGYEGRVRPTDLTGFVIRKPTNNELRDILSIPDQGLPLGWLDYNDTNEVFMYPLQPDDTIYQSVMVAGVMGKGKSNFLKLAIRSLASNKRIESEKRPAIIILDGEGEYKQFVNMSEMPGDTRKFLEMQGISDIEPKVYTISDDATRSDATLSLRGIGNEDIIYLMPELEARTENILLVLLNHVTRIIQYENAGQDIATLRNRLIAEANTSGLVHMQQRPAIARAVLSQSLDLLDQKGKIPITPGLLFRPGTVSVINYQGLPYNKKRVVALYILQMLSKFKMDAPNYEPGVLLVIDEAELLFPANPSKADKDYVTRIASRLEDITNRGRKRKYGAVFVTHLPSEVSQQVGDLANTKVAFACSGANKWIRDVFGKDHIDEINSLPTGTCRIKIKVDNKDQGPINARIKIPFVGSEDSLKDRLNRSHG